MTSEVRFECDITVPAMFLGWNNNIACLPSLYMSCARRGGSLEVYTNGMRSSLVKFVLFGFDGVVAFKSSPNSLQRIRQFCLMTSSISCVLLFCIAFIPAIHMFFLSTIIAVKPDVVQACIRVMRVFVAFPFIVTVRAYFIGVAVLLHRTGTIGTLKAVSANALVLWTNPLILSSCHPPESNHFVSLSHLIPPPPPHTHTQLARTHSIQPPTPIFFPPHAPKTQQVFKIQLYSARIICDCLVTPISPTRLLFIFIAAVCTYHTLLSVGVCMHVVI